ncbi:MAG: TspO/MBR family protein, partial [Raoultibacter sp.]
MSQKVKNVLLWVGCIAVPLLIGFLSSLLAGDIKGIYEMLVQPPLSPPTWLFGIVWPILYILMGTAFYRLIRAQSDHKKTLPIVLFCVQLLLNFFWSIV